MGILHLLGALALGSLSLGAAPLPRLASDPIVASKVPQPLAHQQGNSVGYPVFFTDQEGIDALCGGNNQVVACAMVNGNAMALPNPCQARFKGESYAAVLCHEQGHLNGWNHEG